MVAESRIITSINCAAIIYPNTMSEDSATCRDFERGVCNRGDKCRYAHPEDVKSSENKKLPICKDFQNKGCSRSKCKFLHITVDEEAEYMQSGSLPEHGGRPDLAGSASHYPGGGGGSGREICKDFLNNICDRGSRCKFSHAPDNGGSMMGGHGVTGGAVLYGKRFRDDSYHRGMMGSVSTDQLVDENEMLKRKITDLQKQVIELRQMNDTLYDQNTRYRAQLQQGNPTLAGTAAHTSVSQQPSQRGSSNTDAYNKAAPSTPYPPAPAYNYSNLR